MTDRTKQSPAEDDRRLIAAYVRAAVTLDAIPYSSAMDEILRYLARPSGDARTVLDRLTYLRKSGRLPQLGRDRTLVVSLDRMTDVHFEWLTNWVRVKLGSIGRRDQLPYSDDFDVLFEEFVKQFPDMRDINKNEVWLAVARRAKLGLRYRSAAKGDDTRDPFCPGPSPTTEAESDDERERGNSTL
jgi:hypothetical protein